MSKLKDGCIGTLLALLLLHSVIMLGLQDLDVLVSLQTLELNNYSYGTEHTEKTI